MFERRLKIFVALLSFVALVMILRAGQLQMLQHARWTTRANEANKRFIFIETRRGKILDSNGVELAFDDACLDAMVDYRAISKDPEWLKKVALDRLPPKAETNASGISRAQLIAAEIKRVTDDIDAMWGKIAMASGKSLEEIEETRYAIVQRVELRRKMVWYALYEKALARQENQGPSPWYKSWLFDDAQTAFSPDSIKVSVAEEQEPHVILRNIDSDVNVRLTKMMNQLPGLKLQQSTHRVYPSPADKVLAQSMGHMSMVLKEDLLRDPNLKKNELRQYLPNDLIGREGIEGAAERWLRGSKGRLDKYLGDRDWHETAKPVPGQDVHLTIDIELQSQVMDAFKLVHAKDTKTGAKLDVPDMHGAAVVLDVPTNEVRALVSYPTYDANRFDVDYATLTQDQINSPLRNRATCSQYPPGSTVKTIVGSTAITRGLLGVHEGIECTGYLRLPNDRGQLYTWTRKFRCWTANMWATIYPGMVSHHQISSGGAHRGRFGNPDGSLIFADALERSCNVFFETVGDRMQIDGVGSALQSFGLGRKTGIGILEMPGHLPNPAKLQRSQWRMESWLDATGQGLVCATPIQMANVAATLARNGIWMRPRLFQDHQLDGNQPDRIDLGLSSEAMAAAREGMIAVANSPSGTGTEAALPDVLVAAKTGSAQAGKFSTVVMGNDGKPVRTPDGKLKRVYYEPGAWPWYRGVGEGNTHTAHAWMIAYAPADNPQVAICVFLEYGGGGGTFAGPIVQEIVKACIKRGYVKTKSTAVG